MKKTNLYLYILLFVAMEASLMCGIFCLFSEPDNMSQSWMQDLITGKLYGVVLLATAWGIHRILKTCFRKTYTSNEADSRREAMNRENPLQQPKRG